MKANANYGFKPHQETQTTPADVSAGSNGEKEKSKTAATPATEAELLALKKELSALVGRYPKIQLRSTFKLLEKLDGCSKEELENMLLNANNDIAILSGTPGAEIILSNAGAAMEVYIPCIEEELMKDQYLMQDIENVIFSYIGIMGPMLNIPLRVMSAVTRARKRSHEPEDEGDSAKRDTGNIDDLPRTKKSKSTQPVANGAGGGSGRRNTDTVCPEL